MGNKIAVDNTKPASLNEEDTEPEFVFDCNKIMEPFDLDTIKNEYLVLEKLLNELDTADDEPFQVEVCESPPIPPKDENLCNKVKVYPFNRKQQIDRIRSKLQANKSQFIDKYFPPHINIVGSLNSTFVANFSNTQQYKWERVKVISYYKRGINEFVLNNSGKPLKSAAQLDKSFFSVGDIYQGSLGDCFFIGMILGLTRNLELLTHVMPLDNAIKSNTECSVYHFRFWRLGFWYDLVIDDYLLVDCYHNLVFAKNLTCPNEYWICLLEKAFAK